MAYLKGAARLRMEEQAKKQRERSLHAGFAVTSPFTTDISFRAAFTPSAGQAFIAKQDYSNHFYNT
jgi:hypothetical protein